MTFPNSFEFNSTIENFDLSGFSILVGFSVFVSFSLLVLAFAFLNILDEQLETMDNAFYKKCPSCPLSIERDGCNHMICTCLTQFCGKCGVEYAHNVTNKKKIYDYSSIPAHHARLDTDGNPICDKWDKQIAQSVPTVTAVTAVTTETTESTESINGNFYKKCPDCCLYVVSDGCNHMICQCLTQFCGKCGVEYAHNMNNKKKIYDYRSIPAHHARLGADGIPICGKWN